MKAILALMLLLTSPLCLAGDGKILATPGVTQFEGSGGGGIVPWAMLSGYATRGQMAGSVFATHVQLNDFRLDMAGASVNLHDRLEISVAHQSLRVDPLDTTVREDIFGLKARLYGNIVYSRYPQLSAGLQAKHNDTAAIVHAVGGKHTSGTDFYLAASKLQLGAVFGYNLFWDVTARATRANQTGLLGFGGDRRDHYTLEVSGSAALFLSSHLAAGAEYRAKPDNLSAIPEDDWQDVFLAWFPDKRINVTLAWANLGNIAGVGTQRGVYLSLTGYP